MKKEVSVAYIEDAENMVLFLIKKDESLWSLPGGKLKKTENKLTALDRELQEELGFTSDKIKIKIDCGSLVTEDKIIHVFYCVIDKFPMIKLSKEHQDYIFVDAYMLDNLLEKMKPITQKVYHALVEHLNKFIDDHKSFIS